MSELVKTLFCVVALTVILLGLSEFLAGAIDDNVCNALDERLSYDEKLEWIGYPDGWELPPDLEFVGLLPLAPLEDMKDNAHYGQYYSRSENALYIWYFEDLRADGNPYGQHHICPQVWKIGL